MKTARFLPDDWKRQNMFGWIANKNDRNKKHKAFWKAKLFILIYIYVYIYMYTVMLIYTMTIFT